MAEQKMADRSTQAQGIRAGYFDRDAFRQKTRSILVLQTAVAGLRYCVNEKEEAGAALLRALTPGTELRLFREPDNAADPWAIAVYTVGGQKLGYVPHFKNETIARLMDCGKAFHAYMEKPPQPENPDGFYDSGDPENPDQKGEDPPQRKRMRAITEDERFPFAVYMEES
jgi:hypothetical protein